MIEPERKDTERSKEPEPTWEKGEQNIVIKFDRQGK